MDEINEYFCLLIGEHVSVVLLATSHVTVCYEESKKMLSA